MFGSNMYITVFSLKAKLVPSSLVSGAVTLAATRSVGYQKGGGDSSHHEDCAQGSRRSRRSAHRDYHWSCSYIGQIVFQFTVFMNT